MNYFEKHIGDYLKDTAHLSLLEHGIYNRLFDVYYTREGGIPSTDAARLIGARSKEEKQALQSVLAEFFMLRDGLHVQDRCDREIERYHGKQAKAKASADARWNAQRSQSSGDANASGKQDAPAMRTHSEGNAPRARPQTPDTRHQKENPPTPKGAVHGFPPGFAEFWSAYPKKVGKDAAARAFAKRKFDLAAIAAVLRAVEAQRASPGWTKDGGQFVPNPATWLNEGRWQDEFDTGTSNFFEGNR